MRRFRTTEDWFIDIINTGLLLILAFITLYPFYYSFIISLNEGRDTVFGGIYFWPRKFTIDNYIYFLKESKWYSAFVVSVLRTVIGTGITVFLTCLMAYGLSQHILKFKKIYFGIIIVGMYTSGGLIAYYVTLRGIGLLNSFLVYVIPSAVSIFFLLIAVSFFREIPPELGESARMDGATELHIFVRIILPISMPLLATMSLFTGAGQWNSWFDAAFFVNQDYLRTLSFRMIEVLRAATSIMTNPELIDEQLRNRTETLYSVQVTALMIATLPIVFVYPFLQKYFVKGMMLGSVKG